MSTATRTVAEALAAAQAEIEHPSQNWHNQCLVFVRTCWGIPAQQPTAFDAWKACPASAKHVGGDPADAPVGAALFYKGSDPAGHIMLAGHVGAFSNDLLRDGKIDHVSRTAPITKWGHVYLGWTSQVNGVDLPLNVAPPVPKPTAHPNVNAARDSLRKADRANKPGRIRDAIRAALRALRIVP